jgi:flagellar hook protein FlgE
MGILSSLYTGITGLKGQGEALSIYADNLANANTNGFKVSRPEFSDVVAKSLKGLLGGNQIGRGTRLQAVNPIFSQGSVIQTESATDIAILGDGFFVLEGQEGRAFTRNGAFHFDKDGKLINADNYHVMGFQADKNGRITSKMGTISVDRTVIDAKKTENVDLFMNLDLKADKLKLFDPERPDETAHFATGVTVFDSSGTAHVVTLYFNKEEDNQWHWRAMAKGEDIIGGEDGKLIQQASGKLTFDTDGALLSQEVESSSFNFKGGAQPDHQISFNFGKDKAQGGDGLSVTHFGTASEAYKTTQDGYTAGTLKGLTFNDDGTLTAVYSNGENVNLAQVVLAKFENPEGLFKAGGNRFRESRLSGQPTVGAPQTGGRGSVSPKAIESSTTDIANEFINLMGAQRNFQANTRVVKTSDEMMQEILSIRG